MKRSLLFLVGVAANLGIAVAGHASLINPSFESGDTSGWTILGQEYARVETRYDHGAVSYAATDGTHFLRLWAGSPAAGFPTEASQSVVLTASQRLSGWAAFLANDSLPYNDSARVWIAKDGQSEPRVTLWYSDVALVGNLGASPWQAWSWQAPSDGRYTLFFEVRNGLDTEFDSEALFDVQVAAPVPEPSTLLLLGTGLAGLGATVRRLVRRS